jgi:lon-related putative ATP-dependent protease
LTAINRRYPAVAIISGVDPNQSRQWPVPVLLTAPTGPSNAERQRERGAGAAMAVKPLPVERLFHRCDPAAFPFKSTADLPDPDRLPGQDRALEAIDFGVDIKRHGYNLFAMGPPGIGKHAVVRELLARAAARAPTPRDLCYVNNFADPQRPAAMRLPPGTAVKLRADMAELVDDLRTAMPGIFEGEDYRRRREAIEDEFKQRQETAFETLQEHGKAKSVALMRTPLGFAFAPVRDGSVLGPEEFAKLPRAEQEKIKNDLESLQDELQATIRKFPEWDKERRERLRTLSREVTMFAVGHVIDRLQERYKDQSEIVAYLNAVETDIVEHVDMFLNAGPAERRGAGPTTRNGDPFRRYRINVLVDNGGQKGAPVVYEDNPTLANLIGAVEHIAEMGTLVTDFDLIKPGALHRANGGFLVIDVRKLLFQPFSWEALKRALRAEEIKIESLGQMLNLISTVSLEPQPVAIEVKVVLLGERILYYLLNEYDPDMPDLFKVAADFEDDMDRNKGTVDAYARLIAATARREGLKPLDPGAVARVVEQSSRFADDARKLSMRLSAVADLLREADHGCATAGRKVIQSRDVQTAIDAARRRQDRLRDRMIEAIDRDLILIDTDGAKTGQINGLSVIAFGGMSFGRPSRITARIRLGRGEVVDIERQVELGGPIHSKGVLILASYLGARYALKRPLSLSATLVFEQSYSGVEGDSASSAELFALLSALADLPVRQDLAVTGSINQHGEVQVIGGVNEKIEGFFDICRRRGLTGRQGVLIPEGNVQHLMLRQDVIDAVTAGKFQVYPIATVDQGVELLTGIAAGGRDSEGLFPDKSLNRRVEDKLLELAELRRSYGAPAGGKDDSRD